MTATPTRSETNYTVRFEMAYTGNDPRVDLDGFLVEARALVNGFAEGSGSSFPQEEYRTKWTGRKDPKYSGINDGTAGLQLERSRLSYRGCWNITWGGRYLLF
jgi:hypothetical protein